MAAVNTPIRDQQQSVYQRAQSLTPNPTFPSGPPYKAPNRRWYTEGLFWETNLDYRSCLPVFSLYQDVTVEGRALVNCRKTFLDERDPTGYNWAMKYLGEYAHWKLLSRKPWFKAALDGWQEELDTLLQAEALKKIGDIANSSSQSALNAAKYLANLEHRKTSHGRGRPSKVEVAGELKRAAAEERDTTDDYNRVFGASVEAAPKEIN